MNNGVLMEKQHRVRHSVRHTVQTIRKIFQTKLAFSD